MADVFVTIFGADSLTANLTIANQLRAAGLKVEVALDANERLGKQLQAANRRGIPFAVVQLDEQAAGEVVVRNLVSGDQHRISMANLVADIRTLLRKMIDA
jgi:histidyl-tRNA synthetase